MIMKHMFTWRIYITKWHFLFYYSIIFPSIPLWHFPLIYSPLMIAACRTTKCYIWIQCNADTNCSLIPHLEAFLAFKELKTLEFQAFQELLFTPHLSPVLTKYWCTWKAEWIKLKSPNSLIPFMLPQLGEIISHL